MELINNIIALKGDKEEINNLNVFLDKHIEKVDEDSIIDWTGNNSINDVQNEKPFPFWFYYDWCEIGSQFFDEILEHETLYFKTESNPSLNTIIEISKLFPKIEFNLEWQPRSIMFECFGSSKIKDGEILELDTTTPQWYLDEIEEMCRIGNEEETVDKNTVISEPQCFIDEEGIVYSLPF